MKTLSKTGLIFSGVYVFGTLVTFIYALTCHTEFCGIVALGPVMPLAVVISGLFPEFVDFPWFFIFAFLIAVILYFSGVGLEKLDKMVFLKNKFSVSRVALALFLLANALYLLEFFYYTFFA